MRINSIHLAHFRNHKSAEFSFPSVTTFIVGENAVGKTNILEAISMLSNSKPLRGLYDLEVIMRGKKYCRIEGEVGSKDGGSILEVFVENKDPNTNTTSKSLKVNKASKSLANFTEHFQAVTFSPEHIECIYGAPKIRRIILNNIYTQYSREYQRTLREYTNIRRQRNRLLAIIKETGGDLDELSVWDEQLIERGEYLQQRRAAYLEYLQVYMQNHAEDLHPGAKSVKVLYEKSELNQARLNEFRSREIASQRSLIGPHRDDFKVMLDGKDLGHFGSRGEQRSIVLMMKMAELTFLKQETGERPVLLLDDIFSEFDSEHRENIFHLLGEQQTIVTATDLDHIDQGLLGGAKVIRL